MHRAVDGFKYHPADGEGSGRGPVPPRGAPRPRAPRDRIRRRLHIEGIPHGPRIGIGEVRRVVGGGLGLGEWKSVTALRYVDADGVDQAAAAWESVQGSSSEDES